MSDVESLFHFREMKRQTSYPTGLPRPSQLRNAALPIKVDKHRLTWLQRGATGP
jgi:hypothetical protein